MSNYSITHQDMSREVREELYDGTARLTFVDPDGTETVTLVASGELPPEPEPALDVPALVAAAEAGSNAQTLDEMRDAFAALLNSLGVNGG